MNKQSIKKLLFQFRLIEKALSYDRVRERSISDWSTLDHLEHAIISTEKILKKIQSDLVECETSVSFLGRVVLVTGIIPRNKGHSPKSLIPTGMCDKKLLKKLSCLKKECFNILNNWEELQVSKKKMPHHIFGMMTGDQWIKFAYIHNKHHIGIAREIVSSKADNFFKLPTKENLFKAQSSIK